MGMTPFLSCTSMHLHIRLPVLLFPFPLILCLFSIKAAKAHQSAGAIILWAGIFERRGFLFPLSLAGVTEALALTSRKSFAVFREYPTPFARCIFQHSLQARKQALAGILLYTAFRRCRIGMHGTSALSSSMAS
jgi:hypothetical protein